MGPIPLKMNELIKTRSKNVLYWERLLTTVSKMFPKATWQKTTMQASCNVAQWCAFHLSWPRHTKLLAVLSAVSSHVSFSTSTTFKSQFRERRHIFLQSTQLNIWSLVCTLEKPETPNGGAAKERGRSGGCGGCRCKEGDNRLRPWVGGAQCDQSWWYLSSTRTSSFCDHHQSKQSLGDSLFSYG